MVCVPNGAPHCEECPWNAFCEARLQERIDELPVKKKKAARRIEERTVFILRDGEKIALHKRPGKGLLAGLYELPNCEPKLNQQEALQYIEDLGYRPIRIVPLAEAKHIFSHVEWHMKGYAVLIEEPGREFPDFPNLFLLDKTEPPIDLWENTDSDTLEGIYFQLLRRAMEEQPENARQILLAAEISRKLLDGREVTL